MVSIRLEAGYCPPSLAIIGRSMSGDISYSRLVHGDTNILSQFAKQQELWRPLQDFLHAQDLCLGVSGAQAAELSSDNRLHDPLNMLLTAVPSAVIKAPDVVLNEDKDYGLCRFLQI